MWGYVGGAVMAVLSVPTLIIVAVGDVIENELTAAEILNDSGKIMRDVAQAGADFSDQNANHISMIASAIIGAEVKGNKS